MPRFGKLGASFSHLGASGKSRSGALFTATGLPNWQAAARNVISGAGPSIAIANIGDSTMRSASASPAGSWGINSEVPVLAGQMNAVINSQSNTWMGIGGIAGSPTLADSRIAIGAWSATGAVMAGGTSLLATSAATCAFTPPNAFKTIKIRYAQFAGGGTFNVNVDGGASLAGSPVNTTGASAPSVATFTCALGTHTVNVVWASGTVVILGVETFDDTTPVVSFINYGWGGSKSGDWNNNAAPYSPLGWIGRTDHPITRIRIGINDWENSIATATFSTNVQAMITAAKLAGDVLLETPNTTNGSANIATQATYIAVLQSLATSNSIKLNDIWTNVFGGISQPSLMADSLHPNVAGYAAVAASSKTALTT